MSVDTKTFVAASPSKLLDIMPKLIRNLNEWQRSELAAYSHNKGFDSVAQFLFRDKTLEVNKDLKDFTNGVRIDTHDFECFNIRFTVHDETRSLFITHTCSCDNEDVYEGDKISFGLGMWGGCADIMKVVNDTLKEFGRVFHTPNDCSEEYEELFV